MSTAKYGAVAAGHSVTANAAIEILESGGNAFDAVVAAALTACVSEPLLASLGGGGFLTARDTKGSSRIYDFFVQTPSQYMSNSEADFYPVSVDFGTSQQDFHIGAGSVATPGMVKGLFKILSDLGTMPPTEVCSLAVTTAKKGVRLNPLQSYLYSILSPILLATPESSALFGNTNQKVKQTDELQCFDQMADLIEILSIEGEKLFYHGEVCKAITQQTSLGGHINSTDLHTYEVVIRQPHQVSYGDFEIVTNPIPSTGGVLIGFALQLLQGHLHSLKFGSPEHLSKLAQVMELTNKARMDIASLSTPCNGKYSSLDTEIVEKYRNQIVSRPAALRGTTHISVADVQGNQASLTLSNGEGCGKIVPGCGFMLNNMLGEQDLNPNGFGKWHKNSRMTSMMAPSLMRDRRNMRDYVLGSGGSNRIRSAILQVLLNLMEFKQTVNVAVDSPRLHSETGRINLEPGFSDEATSVLNELYSGVQVWKERNLYFGGVHTLSVYKDSFVGVGDSRRGGVYLVS